MKSEIISEMFLQLKGSSYDKCIDFQYWNNIELKF